MSGDRQWLIPGPDGIFVGVDPGTDGAAALVRRDGDRLLLVRVAFARGAGKASPATRAARTIRALFGVDGGARDGLVGAAVEAPAARALQSGALVLAQSAGAYAGVLAWQHGLDPEMPRADVWLADLACLADRGTDAGQRKALHVARLLDVCPGAEQHVTPERARLAHDGGADAALLALWAAGLRGPGPSATVWALDAVHMADGWCLQRYLPDPIEGDERATVWSAETATGLASVAAGGRWAAARGRRVVSSRAETLLRGLIAPKVGRTSAAVRREASAALLAWGVTDGD